MFYRPRLPFAPFPVYLVLFIFATTTLSRLCCSCLIRYRNDRSYYCWRSGQRNQNQGSCLPRLSCSRLTFCSDCKTKSSVLRDHHHQRHSQSSLTATQMMRQIPSSLPSCFSVSEIVGWLPGDYLEVTEKQSWQFFLCLIKTCCDDHSCSQSWSRDESGWVCTSSSDHFNVMCFLSKSFIL